MLDIIQPKGTPATRQYFLVYETHYREIFGTEGNYNTHRFIVIAAANYLRNGDLFDWAAYKGIAPKDCPEKDARRIVAAYGDKLTEREVKFYLHGQPNLAGLLKRYRE